jgi:hypothetical protein
MLLPVSVSQTCWKTVVLDYIKEYIMHNIEMQQPREGGLATTHR